MRPKCRTGLTPASAIIENQRQVIDMREVVYECESKMKKPRSRLLYVIEKIGSSGRTRTYNPPVNSRFAKYSLIFSAVPNARSPNNRYMPSFAYLPNRLWKQIEKAANAAFSITSKIGSSGRLRTCNPAVTALSELSLRSGLSHHPAPCSGCRALLGLIGEIPHPLVSARSPLHTLFCGASLRVAVPSDRRGRVP